MVKRVVFDNKLMGYILDLVYQGYKRNEIADKLGVRPTSLDRWRKLNIKFNSLYIKQEEAAMRSIIKGSLTDLAKGYEVSEEIEEFYETRLDKDGNEVKVRRLVKTRKLPPDIKAIKTLANRYAKNVYNDTDTIDINVDVKVTQRDRALTFEERIKLLANDKQDGDVTDVEFKDLIASASS